ncbi:MAG: SHOCT domain-containing protein [Actinomycetota bacterium]
MSALYMWMGPGWLFLSGLLTLAFWIGVGALIVHLVRDRDRHDHQDHLQSRTTSALRLLEERYARGEISREDFLERRAVLSGHAPAVPPAPPQPASGPAEHTV